MSEPLSMRFCDTYEVYEADLFVVPVITMENYATSDSVPIYVSHQQPNLEDRERVYVAAREASLSAGNLASYLYNGVMPEQCHYGGDSETAIRSLLDKEREHPSHPYLPNEFQFKPNAEVIQ